MRANAYLARKAGGRMATHEELMTSLKFGESFRNALRDYYSYGFKKLGDYEKEKVQTIKND